MWEGPAEKDFYFKVKEANNGCLLKKINHKFKREVNFSYKYAYKEMPNGDVIKTHYPTLSLFDLLSSKNINILAKNKKTVLNLQNSLFIYF